MYNYLQRANCCGWPHEGNVAARCSVSCLAKAVHFWNIRCTGEIFPWSHYEWRPSLWKLLKKWSLKIPWILLPLQLFNRVGRHLVMHSGLETGDSWRKLISLCCIGARFPNTTSHPIPGMPMARWVEQWVPKAVVTRNLSLSVCILTTRVFPPPWSLAHLHGVSLETSQIVGRFYLENEGIRVQSFRMPRP